MRGRCHADRIVTQWTPIRSAGYIRSQIPLPESSRSANYMGLCSCRDCRLSAMICVVNHAVKEGGWTFRYINFCTSPLGTHEELPSVDRRTIVDFLYNKSSQEFLHNTGISLLQRIPLHPCAQPKPDYRTVLSVVRARSRGGPRIHLEYFIPIRRSSSNSTMLMGRTFIGPCQL